MRILMEQQKFEAMLILLVPLVIHLIMKNHPYEDVYKRQSGNRHPDPFAEYTHIPSHHEAAVCLEILPWHNGPVLG